MVFKFRAHTNQYDRFIAIRGTLARLQYTTNPRENGHYVVSFDERLANISSGDSRGVKLETILSIMPKSELLVFIHASMNASGDFRDKQVTSLQELLESFDPNDIMIPLNVWRRYHSRCVEIRV